MITTLPTPPLPTDTTADFNTKAFALLNALPLFITEVNTTATDVDADAVVASGSATAAANSAATAMASANYKGEWSTLSGALNIPASVSRNGQMYTLKNNLANVAASTPGVSSDWIMLGGVRLVRVSRSSNTILGLGNAGEFIDITSGTFTQTFDSATNLGANWYCYIRNSGTGDITLDRNASETIDGLTSFVMYPGETRLIQCNGTNFISVVISAFNKTFTTSGTFVRPPGYSYFDSLTWSGGNSGQKSGGAGEALGGGGGGCFPAKLPASAIGSSITITVGAGGEAVRGTAAGNLGGQSSIGTLVTVMQPAIYSLGGAVKVDAVAVSSQSGGDFGGASPGSFGVNALYGGAATAGAQNPGGSVYGGGAGGTVSTGPYIRPPGTSSFGGAGGAASVASNGTTGVAPGGGGGATQTGTASGAGARGEVRIWGVV